MRRATRNRQQFGKLWAWFRNESRFCPKKTTGGLPGTTGPCGPDTEMFYWIDDGTPAPENFQETKNDKRWVEIWNDVFMQYEKKADGNL